MSYTAQIVRPGGGKAHPVQVWARKRRVSNGTLFPAPCPIGDKPVLKEDEDGQKRVLKGKPVIYNNAKLKQLLKQNGNVLEVFQFITRIGGWLFNTAANKHLIGLLKGLLPKWLGKIADNYVPYPLPKGKVARAEKIYCDLNEVIVDQEKGIWAHLKAGTATLTQVEIGTGKYHRSSVKWPVPPGWIEKKYLKRIG